MTQSNRPSRPPPPPPPSTAKPVPPPPPPPFLPPIPPPPPLGPPFLPPNGQRRTLIVVALAAVVIVGLGIGGWLLVADRTDDTGPVSDDAAAMFDASGADASAPRRSSAAAQSESDSLTLPAGAAACPAVYGPVGPYTSSAVGTTITSCPFAEEVRIAYAGAGEAGASRRISARSPVTGTVYDMDCAAGPVITCRGGNDAVVHVY